ncbi:hypothetical protein LINPERPRIM_LOCUS19713 [Linum perenne]
MEKMRKPGTRPYDCVRRAWHSDRHQPIRGSLIQEIFRVVNEVHSSVTKKNKEWQDKLPAVVLRAEEILYSRANSQDEYMDITTLWDRTNDAVNTIIRRDDSAETGHFLHPCIEAVLNLGCPATSASRSQRSSSSNNLRCYLTSSIAHNAIRTDQSIDHSSTPLRKECVPASSSCSVYPLYYGSSAEVGFGVHPGNSEPDLSLWLGCQPAGNVQMKKRKADVFTEQQQQQQQQQHLCLKPRLSI